MVKLSHLVVYCNTYQRAEKFAAELNLESAGGAGKLASGYKVVVVLQRAGRSDLLARMSEVKSMIDNGSRFILIVDKVTGWTNVMDQLKQVILLDFPAPDRHSAHHTTSRAGSGRSPARGRPGTRARSPSARPRDEDEHLKPNAPLLLYLTRTATAQVVFSLVTDQAELNALEHAAEQCIHAHKCRTLHYVNVFFYQKSQHYGPYG